AVPPGLPSDRPGLSQHLPDLSNQSIAREDFGGFGGLGDRLGDVCAVAVQTGLARPGPSRYVPQGCRAEQVLVDRAAIGAAADETGPGHQAFPFRRFSSACLCALNSAVLLRESLRV